MAGPEAVSSRDSLGVQKAPPNSIEAEEALLGSALLSRDASNRLMEAVKPGDFYSPNNEKIFEAMKELFDSGKPIDSVTVSEIVFKSKNTTSLNASYIARLVENVPIGNSAPVLPSHRFHGLAGAVTQGRLPALA